MRTFKPFLLTLILFSLPASAILAQAEGADAAAPGATGINSAWDQESVDLQSGTVHLYIPLYAAQSGDQFGWSVGLSYSSDVWDATDSNFPNSPSARHLHGFGPAGLGWKVGFGRVYSTTYSSGGTSEVRYYFEGQRGDTHRLFRKGIHEVCSTPPFCPPFPPCVPDDYWYAFDGSGIRAQSTPSDPLPHPSTTTWTVWLPDGTTLSMGHYRGVDPDIRNYQNIPEGAYDGWDTTLITGPEPKAGGPSRYTVSIDYYSPSSGMSMCPHTVTDMDNPSRIVTFTCIPNYYVQDAAYGSYLDGAITSIEVPAPSSPTGTQVYDLLYQSPYVLEPFTHDETDGILQLQSVTARGVTPQHRFWFFYDMNPSGLNYVNYAMLNTIESPYGSVRSYQYGVGNVWRQDYPIIFAGAREGQFGFFPIIGLTWRGVSLNENGPLKQYNWDYARNNAPLCASSTPGNCYRTPQTVVVTGPYDYDQPSVHKNQTVYTYKGTPQCSTQTCTSGKNSPGALDGTLLTIEARVSHAGDFAGNPAGPLVRTTSYQYDFDTPDPGCMVIGTFNKEHYADNVRTTSVSTSFDDDGKLPHDLKMIAFSNWTMLTTNVGLFQDTTEYQPDGVTPYRTVRVNSALTPGQLAAWILRPLNWRRTLDASGNVKNEVDFTFDDYGRPTTVRNLYAPGATPKTTSQDDLLTTLGYDSTTGNRSSTLSQIPRQGVNLGSTVLSWSAGLPTRTQVPGLSWYSFDVDREPNWGLPIAMRRSDGTGVTIQYDTMGRVTTVRPLAGSSDPPIDITYDGGWGSYQTTTVVGGYTSDISESKTILDGQGRIAEEQRLKPEGWVSRKYTHDVVGNTLTETEWAPVGATSPPVTSKEYWGTYNGVSGVFVDPFLRLRKIVAPDGATTTKSYQALVTTTTVQGIQGGTAASPTPFNSVTTETMDIFRRLFSSSTQTEGAPNPDRTVEHTYDILDRSLQLSTKDPNDLTHPQVKSAIYDSLGRVKMTTDPERGRIWVGTITGGGTDTAGDGYDALGNVIRYELESGFAASPATHYHTVYDPAGRLTLTEKREDATLTNVSAIADYLYDDASHGNGTSQNGRLSRVRAYDSAVPPAITAQNDYYYQGPSGLLNQLKTTLAGIAPAYSTYYTYDANEEITAMAYPTTDVADPGTGMPPCLTNTCLSFTHAHGVIAGIGSSRGTQMVQSAVYGNSGQLTQWVAGNGASTQTLPDTTIDARPQEIKVLNSAGMQLWTSGAYGYDAAGFVKGIGSDISTYDALGRLKETQIAGTSGTILYDQAVTYDPFGNILSRTTSTNDPLTPPTTTSYNVDRATNRIRGLGTATNWTYDTDGVLRHDDSFDYLYDNARRLSSVQKSGSAVGTYRYDASGLRIYRKDNQGKETYYFRDLDGNVASQFSRRAGSTDTPAWDRDFVYFNGQRISMIENPTPPAPTNLTKVASDCSVANNSLAWSMPSTPPDLVGYFVYRTTSAGSYGASLNSIPVTTTAYVDHNVPLHVTYYYQVRAIDTAGNLSDWSNQISARINMLCQVRGPSPASDIQMAHAPESADGLAPYVAAGQVDGPNILFLHSDYQGSLRLVTDTTGYVATTHKYLPFGEEVQAMKSMDPYKYAGYELDLESGMDYARARYYSSSTGRWLTPDPLGDGYAYVSNNPMNYTDPTGLCGGGPGSITEYCLVTAPFHNVGSSGGGGSRPLYVLGPLDEPKLIPGKSPTPPEPNAFKDCMAANASAFSLAGIAEFIPNYALNAWGADTRVNFKDNAIVSFLGGNEIADFLTAGALPTYDLSQEAFDRGLGVPLSVGRHSTDIRALNVAGKGGRPLALGEAALGIKGLSKTAGNVLGLGLTLGERASIDAALTAIEAVGCAAGAMMSP